MFGNEILQLTRGFGADLGCGMNPLPTATHIVDCNGGIFEWKHCKEVHLRDINEGFNDWPSDHFDFVFSRYLVEELRNPITFLNTCYRVTKPNGRLVIGTTTMKRFELMLGKNSVAWETVVDSSGHYYVIQVPPVKNDRLLKEPDRVSPCVATHCPWPAISNPPTDPEFTKLSVVLCVSHKTESVESQLAAIAAALPRCELVVATECPTEINFILNRDEGDLFAVLSPGFEPTRLAELAVLAWEHGIAAQRTSATDSTFTRLPSPDHRKGAIYPDGPALFVRKDVWSKVGSLDDRLVSPRAIFLDWGLRARLAGCVWASPEGLDQVAPSPELPNELDAERLNLKFSGENCRS